MCYGGCIAETRSSHDVMLHTHNCDDDDGIGYDDDTVGDGGGCGCHDCDYDVESSGDYGNCDDLNMILTKIC